MNVPDWMITAAVQRVLVVGDDGTAARWLHQHWSTFPESLRARIRYHVCETLKQDKWYPVLKNTNREQWVEFLACTNPEDPSSSG